MWKNVAKFAPAVGSYALAGGAQVSGIRVPLLGYALMVLGTLLLLIPAWPYIKRIHFHSPFSVRAVKEASLQVLENEKAPCVEVEPFPCQPAPYEESSYTSWAELQVKNISASPLRDVSVQIQDSVIVYKVTDGPDRGKYFLGKGIDPDWRPANTAWSESNSPPGQFNVSIPAGAIRNALIAYRARIGPSLGYFNTNGHPPFMANKVVIAVSSPDMRTWEGEYYIEYHATGTGRFEFVQWGEWCKTHEVIDLSDVRR